MKKIHFTRVITAAVLLIAFANPIYCQNAGIGTHTPDASAQLDITSTGKGLLIPRMSSSSITAIPNPAKGLLVYDSVKNQLMVNTGSAAVPNWQNILGNSGWGLSGNGGTSPAVNFIGTTDNRPLLFKINGQWSGIIDSANNSTYVGSLTGKNASGTYGNTAFGAYALGADIHGLGANSALGAQALRNNTTGHNNTAVGTGALYGNTTGNFNTADGWGALFGNSNGSFNTAVGTGALYGNSTPYMSTTPPNYNTAIGEDALRSNSGSYNTANGYQAGSGGTGGGSGNTVSGYQVMPLSGEKNYNTVEGNHSMAFLATGDDNTLLGDYSLKSSYPTSNSGDDHIISQTTAVGYQTLYLTDGAVIGTLDDAWGNTVFGYNAGSVSHNGGHNCFIGAESDITNGSVFNSIVLGHATTAAISNEMRVGNPATSSIGGPVNWSVISDGRVKKNIKENIPGLSFITRLRPVSYNINTAAIESIQHAGAAGNGKQTARALPAKMAAAYKQKEQILYTGFVAQEVEQSARSINYDFHGVDAPKKDNDLYALRYESFVVPLVKSVQELAVQSSQLTSSTETLKTAYQKINERLDALEKKIK